MSKINEVMKRIGQAKRPVPEDPGTYGRRYQGWSKKDLGYLGPKNLKGGGFAGEYSRQSEAVTVNGKEVEYPLMVPTLTEDEVRALTDDIIPNRKPVPLSIERKAIAHAKMRLAAGKSPFFSTKAATKGAPKITDARNDMVPNIMQMSN